MIDPEEYDAWKDHPVTKAVFAELTQMAEDRKLLWIARSWNAGECDPHKLAMLRGQAEAFAWLPGASYEQVFESEKEE